MKKRILAMLLCVVMLVGILPISAFAANVTATGNCGDKATWTYADDGTLTISGTGEMKDYSEYFPSWYKYMDKITKVVIKSGITSISNGAFEYLTKLTSISIPATIKTIGNKSFGSCNVLKSITIPSAVTSIGTDAFYDCFALTKLNIPANVTKIGDGSFVNCYSLATITVDSANKYYSSDSKGALYNKSKTELICVSASASGKYSVANTVTTIKNFAFINSASISEIYIPASVSTIEHDGLAASDTLAKISVASDNKTYSSDSYGVLFNKDKSKLILAGDGFSGTNGIYTIPNGVKIIGESAFADAMLLDEIKISSSITDIEDSAFLECGFGGITIPASVKNIGAKAFAGCGALRSVYFMGTAPKIAADAFDEVTATVYYPRNDSSWTNSVRVNYEGELTWKSFAPEYNMGDVNTDGDVSNSDIVMLARYIVGALDGNINEDNIKMYGDMNSDGNITNADLIVLAKEIVG